MENPECNCGSTIGYYKNGEEQIIHFEDCALIQSRLVQW